MTDQETDLQIAMTPPRTPLQESWRVLRCNPLAMVGLVTFLLFCLVATTGVIVTSGKEPVVNPATTRLPESLRRPFSIYNSAAVKPEDAPPFGIYLLGTDSLGRDVFSRMLQGAWVSLTIGFVAVSIAVTIGIVLGGLAGYFGRWTDVVIMRFVDTMLCIPTFFLILTVIALAGGGIFKIMVIVGLTGWMGTARFVRAEFLSLREQDFVSAARALGAGNLRIIFRHMIPNALAPVLVSATIGIAGTILGFGVPEPHATWGKILADGKNYLFDAPWLTYIPGFSILIVVLSFNLFGEGLRDACNPKLRERGT